MLRGITTFTCDNCGNKFEGPGIKYMTTALIILQPCPNCDSKNTYLKSLLGLNKQLHKQVWEPIDNVETH